MSSEQLRNAARMEYGIDCVNNYNFAFVGTSGAGKSSLINAIQGIRDCDEGAARVDEVECTTTIKAYPYPRHPHIVLWDLPGGGTPRNGAENYFLNKKLYAFDMLVIVTSDRFTELDKAIATSAHNFNVPTVFLRSKSDVAIVNASRRLGRLKRDVKNEVRQSIVNDIKGQLPSQLMDREVFVVSSRVFGPPEEDFDQDVYALDETRMIEHIVQVALARRGSGRVQTSLSRFLPPPIAIEV